MKFRVVYNPWEEMVKVYEEIDEIFVDFILGIKVNPRRIRPMDVLELTKNNLEKIEELIKKFEEARKNERE